MLTVDLNCDLGEGCEEDIIPYITSANIACGFHAGGPDVMRRTVRDCIRHGIAVGAHPGYPDTEGFGRRSMDLGFEETVNLILYQVGALRTIAAAEGAKLRHVKVHG
ncbi:LamB/YcsF family protein, partial [bacterium]